MALKVTVTASEDADPIEVRAFTHWLDDVLAGYIGGEDIELETQNEDD